MEIIKYTYNTLFIHGKECKLITKELRKIGKYNHSKLNPGWIISIFNKEKLVDILLDHKIDYKEKIC